MMWTQLDSKQKEEIIGMYNEFISVINSINNCPGIDPVSAIAQIQSTAKTAETIVNAKLDEWS